MRKRIAIISGIIIILLLVIMLAVPLLFENQVAGIVKKEANKQLKATLNFGDVNLNLFEHFPNLSLNIDDLTIINKEPFKGDTLLYVPSFEASIDLWSVIGGDKIKINSIKLDDPDVMLYVRKDSVANYDIVIDTTKEEEKESNLNLGIKEYEISSADIAYIDETSDIQAFVRNLSHTGNGDFTKDIFDLDTKTLIEYLTVEMNGIPYLKDAKVDLDMELQADMGKKMFTLKNNELHLNDLKMVFNGYVRQNEDSSFNMDMTFKAPGNDFKEIVSLIPEVYSKEFASAKSSGNMSLNGFVKGILSEDRIPAFNFDLNIKNGSLQYNKLPSKLNNVAVDMNISNPGGVPDNTLLNLRKLHFELGADPFDARVMVKTPQSNPYIDMAAKGRLNLGALKNAIALKNISKLEGLVNADFEAKGVMSDIKSKRTENIQARGKLNLSAFAAEGSSIPQPVKISTASLSFTPNNFVLEGLRMTIGKNDLSASGTLSNVISYVFKDAVMSGKLNVSSNYFDLNPFMQDDNAKKQPAAKEKKLEAIELPENINFSMNSTFNKLLYDNLTLENVKGQLILNNGRLSMQSLNMNLLGGSLVASGYYENKTGTPDVNFNLAVTNFNIQSAYENFVTIRTLAPLAQFIHGNFDANIAMSSVLGMDMIPVWNSFNSKGVLNLKKAQVKDFKAFNAIGNTLKIEELKDPAISGVKPAFSINNGRFYVAPFKFKVANNELTVAGSNGLDKSLDYSVEMLLPVSSLRTQANRAVSGLIKRDISLVKADKIPVKAIIRGNVNDPAVTTSAGNIAEEAVADIKQEVKTAVNKEVEKKTAEVKKEVAKRADTLRNKAEEEAKKKLKDLFKRK